MVVKLLGGAIRIENAKEISDRIVRSTDRTITPEFCRTIREMSDKKNITLIEIVHKSKTEDIYRLASEGKLSLFYCPTPIRPAIACESGSTLTVDSNGYNETIINMTDNPKITDNFLKYVKLDNLVQRVKRFFNLNPLNYYFVSADKAMPLFEMIKNKHSPKEITDYLGLENRVSSKNEIYQRIKISPTPALATT